MPNEDFLDGDFYSREQLLYGVNLMIEEFVDNLDFVEDDDDRV